MIHIPLVISCAATVYATIFYVNGLPVAMHKGDIPGSTERSIFYTNWMYINGHLLNPNTVDWQPGQRTSCVGLSDKTLRGIS